MHRTPRAPLASFSALLGLAATLHGCGSSGAGAAVGETAPPVTTTQGAGTHAAGDQGQGLAGARPSTVSAAASDPCAEDGAAARAVRVTLAHAQREGIAHAALADCSFDAAHCGAEPEPPAEGADGARCVVVVQAESADFQLRVRPRALTGSPRWIDATLDANAADPPTRFYVGASTWAVGRRAELVLGGVDGHISHTHGGQPARVDHAELAIRNGTLAPLRVTARRVEWLTSGTCTVPSEVRAEPRVAGLTLAGGGARAPEVSIAAGAQADLSVWFAPQSAYYAYCDRFAARVTLDVSGETIVTVAEWEVSSRAPRGPDAP